MGALEGKIAFVTGASGGIGRTIALRIAEEGGDVALFARNAERLQETAEMVEALGRKAQCFPADVSDAAASKEAVNAALEAFGRVDVLVNNAGVTRDGLFMRMSVSDWDDVMNINLKGVFNFSQAVTRTMMKQKSGSIISITSIIGLIGNAGQCNYAASKAGIIGFTKSLAKELASRNIRANAVAPGFIETDMTDAMEDKAREAIAEQIPMKRLGAGEDVANVVVFLASDAAAYITGQTLNVSGGLVMS